MTVWRVECTYIYFLAGFWLDDDSPKMRFHRTKNLSNWKLEKKKAKTMEKSNFESFSCDSKPEVSLFSKYQNCTPTGILCNMWFTVFCKGVEKCLAWELIGHVSAWRRFLSVEVKYSVKFILWLYADSPSVWCHGNCLHGMYLLNCPKYYMARIDRCAVTWRRLRYGGISWTCIFDV